MDSLLLFNFILCTEVNIIAPPPPKKKRIREERRKDKRKIRWRMRRKNRPAD
jgi:hypothetical protein